MLTEREALYGGAAGGGKSDALLMGALQFVDRPSYSGIIFRRTYADLARPSALMDRAHEWLGSTAAAWRESTKSWRFPSGAVITFGYLDNPLDIYKYQGGEYQYIAFDELTQFKKEQYLYLLSRLRRGVAADIPLRMRTASNPGGVGHAWVYERFVLGPRPFVSARLDDNPYLDQEEYRQALMELDDITRDQLLSGLWVTDPSTRAYLLDWWRGKNRYDAADGRIKNIVVGRWASWDTALKDEPTNAFTARVLFELLPDYRVLVRHVRKERVLGVDVADLIVEDTRRLNADGKLRGVIIEDASSGSIAIQAIRRRGDWIGRLVRSFNPGKFGDKLKERPQRAALWCKRDSVLLPHPHKSVPWLMELENDLDMWPDLEFFDVGDAFNQGVIFLENLLAEGWRQREGLSKPVLSEAKEAILQKLRLRGAS